MEDHDEIIWTRVYIYIALHPRQHTKHRLNLSFTYSSKAAKFFRFRPPLLPTFWINYLFDIRVCSSGDDALHYAVVHRVLSRPIK